MSGKSEIPFCRNPDGIYFCVVRNGKYTSYCYSDLTVPEQLRLLCRCLCSSLRLIGDTLDLVFDE